MAENTDIKKRPVAERMFACEFKDTSFSEKDASNLKSPVYVITPLGLEANRVFFVGVMLGKEHKEDKNGDWSYRASINDGTGNFYISANKYNREGLSQMSLLEASPDEPKVVAVIGKLSVNTTDEGRTYRQVRVESITESDMETRHKWILETAKFTAERIKNVKNDSVPKVKKYYERVDVTKYEEPITTLLNSF